MTKRYEERPAVVFAEQWDGTIRGVDKIRKLVLSVPPHIRPDFEVKTEYISHQEPWSVIEFVESRSGYIKERGPLKMREGDWLVKMWDGRLEIMDDDSFKRIYKLAGT